jgi:imidazolonepropionase
MREVMLLTSPRLVTCDAARASSTNALAAIDDGAVLVDKARVAAVGTSAELTARFPDARVVHVPGAITTGLVDAHTHAPWMGSRDAEYALRMSGAGYA